jgi:hypothetical protein
MHAMRAHRTIVAISIALALFAGLASSAWAQAAPKALWGKIITSAKAIDLPTVQRNFVKKLKRQDRHKFKSDADGKWTIHFVAFFNRALPVESIGVVVLDAKKEPVALAEVGAAKGQRTLAAKIVVDTTESPGKNHTLQVYYAKGKKPMVLAKKQIILK